MHQVRDGPNERPYRSVPSVCPFGTHGISTRHKGPKFLGTHWWPRNVLLQSRPCGEGMIASHRVAVEILAKRFRVSGEVQGVGFRFFAERVAGRLGVAGYVKNLFDGRVEVYAIGNAPQLESLASELRRGPRTARVDQIEEIDAGILPEYSNGFTIEQDD